VKKKKCNPPFSSSNISIIDCEFEGHQGYRGRWNDRPSNRGILTLTTDPNNNICGAYRCNSKRVKYKLRYDPIVQELELLEQAYDALAIKTVKMPPYKDGKIASPNNVTLTGKVIAMIGGKKNKYCRVEANSRIKCKYDEIGEFGKFVIEAAGGDIAFKGGQDQKYCKIQGNKNGIECTSQSIGESEKFNVVGVQGSFKFALQPASKDKYCSDPYKGEMECSKKDMGAKEIFTAEEIAAAPTPAPNSFFCPAGYSLIDKNSTSAGEYLATDSMLFVEDCAKECDNRDNCVGFAYTTPYQYYGTQMPISCITHTGEITHVTSSAGYMTWKSCIAN